MLKGYAGIVKNSQRKTPTGKYELNSLVYLSYKYLLRGNFWLKNAPLNRASSVEAYVEFVSCKSDVFLWHRFFIDGTCNAYFRRVLYPKGKKHDPMLCDNHRSQLSFFDIWLIDWRCHIKRKLGNRYWCIDCRFIFLENNYFTNITLFTYTKNFFLEHKRFS